MARIADTNQRRAAYQKIAEREALKAANAGKTIADARAVADAVRNFSKDVTANLPARVAIRLANDFKAGMTAWPELTLYSRNHFYGGEFGLYNSASYAPSIEEGKGGHAKNRGVARDYCESHFNGYAEKIVGKQVRAANRR